MGVNNMQSASKELVCNSTCVYFLAPTDDPKIISCDSHKKNVLRPKGGTCEFHSLRGYTGGMKKVKNAMLYAEECLRKQKEEIKKEKR